MRPNLEINDMQAAEIERLQRLLADTRSTAHSRERLAYKNGCDDGFRSGVRVTLAVVLVLLVLGSVLASLASNSAAL